MLLHAMNIDLRIYPLAVIKRAGYRMADQCTLMLGSTHDDLISVSLAFGADTSEAAREATIRAFHRHLLDEDLRARIRAETDALRAVILAHTFSRMDILSR